MRSIKFETDLLNGVGAFCSDGLYTIDALDGVRVERTRETHKSKPTVWQIGCLATWEK